MKLSQIASCALILVFASVFINTTTQAKENSLKKGKWALQFEIDRDFDLSGFQGQTLSVKKHTADNRAYRLGLTISLSAGDGELIEIRDDTLMAPVSSDANSRGLAINLQRIQYTDISAPVNLFYGFGVAATFSHSKNDDQSQRIIDTLTIINTRESVSDSWSAGVSGILGAEWFFAKNMSLLGEYSTGANYNSSTSKRESRTYYNGQTVDSASSEDDRNSFRISSSSVKFGLSVYF